MNVEYIYIKNVKKNVEYIYVL